MILKVLRYKKKNRYCVSAFVELFYFLLSTRVDKVQRWILLISNFMYSLSLNLIYIYVYPYYANCINNEAANQKRTSL